MTEPMTQKELEEVAEGIAATLYPRNPVPRRALSGRLRAAMADQPTREAQDAAGRRMLEEVAAETAEGPVRCCRLSADECARRCDVLPGGCDTYGDGLTPDGLASRVVGRRWDGEAVQLTIVGVRP